ncbi:MAG: PKD domain-containing protein [Candidatus Gracilibacteria bacterium]|nr:PKD domain-containing protein [Candidatus Gracilibacteria bacterium]
MSKKLAISLVLATVTLQLSGLSSLVLNTEAAVVNKLKQQIPVTNSSTSYDSDWINLVTDSRVSGGSTEEMGPEQGSGYEGDLVRYASQDTSSIRVNLTLEPGDYQFIYIARYGVYEDSHNEFNEDLKFSFGSQSVRVNDPDQDNFMFKIWESDETLVNQSFSLNQSISHFNIEGLGSRVDFGRILISGEATSPENNPAPSCSVSANPNSGQAPLASNFTVTTDARGAGDSIAHFAFNVGDPNQWFGYSYDNDPAYNKDPAGTHGPYTYNNEGTYRVELKVWDTLGQTATCSTTVTVREANYGLSVTKTVSPANTHFYWNDGEEIGKTFSYTMRYRNSSNVALEKVYAFDEFYRTQGNLSDALLNSLKCSPSKNTEATAACQIMDIIRPGQEPFKVIYWNLGTLQPGETGYLKLEGKVKDLAPNWVEGYLLQNDIYIRDAWEGQESPPNIEADDHVDQWLHINGLPSCTISVSPDHGPKELNVDFSMSATDDIEIKRWTLNTGNQSFSGNGMPPSSKNYTYTQIGEYVPELTVYDNNNVSAICQTKVDVIAPPIEQLKNNPPECELSISPESGIAPLDADFVMEARDDKGISSWTLTTGDGKTFSGTGEPPSSKNYTYQKARKSPYTGTLKVTDTNNISVTCTDSIKVNAGPVIQSETDTILQIKKLIKKQGANYIDADSVSSALDLGEVNSDQTIYYKVELKNIGDETARNVMVSDDFTNGSYGSKRASIRNVSGAGYSSGSDTFRITSIEGQETVSFTYEILLDIPEQSSNEIHDIAHNEVTIESFDSNATNQEGVGENDPAYLKFSIPAVITPNATFTIEKAVEDDKMTVSDAEDKEDLDYTITVTNTSDVEGEVRVTDTLKNGDLAGTEGGEFSYNNDLRVSGAISYSGDLDETNGVLLKIAAHQEVTLKYSVEMKNLDEIDSEDDSEFKNTARLSSGEEDSVTVKIETEEADFTIEKIIKDDRNLEQGDIVTYEIKIENIGDSTATVEVTDTISKRKQGSTYYLPGKNGGRLEYIPDSMEVDGISKKNVNGKITSRNGVELEDVEPDDEITISYQMRVVIDGIRPGASSMIDNEACVEFGDEEECDKADLTIIAGFTPVPPLPPLPPPTPTPVTPFVPAIIAPPTYFKTGAAAAALPAGLATSLGALISLYIRKRRLLGL